MLKLSSKLSKALLVIIVMMLVIGGATVPSQAYSTFSTEEFNVTINVREDNTLKVTEEITIYAFSPMHGIYRYIPMRGTARMEIDGSIAELRRNMKIRDINVEGYEYEEYTDSGNMVIKIGSADYTVTAKNTYVISYECTLFEDGVDSKDFFYYNVIPHDWETPISSAEVTVNMPKDFDAEKVWAAAGTSYGYVNEGALEMAIEGNTVRLNAEDLDRGEGITLQIDLPEGYFEGVASTKGYVPVMYGAILATVVIAAMLWFLYGRDPDIVPVVEFRAPDDVTPAEAGYILDEIADKEDIVSMILWFAKNGYLKIKEERVQADGLAGKLLDKETVTYTLQNRHHYAGDKFYAKTIFNGLFASGSNVRLDELKGEFYEHYKYAMEDLRDYFRDDPSKNLFTKSSKVSRKIALVLTGLPMVFALIFSGIIAHTDLMACVPVIFIVTVMGYLIMVSAYDKKYSLSVKKRIPMYLTGFALVALTIYTGTYICHMFCDNLHAALSAAAASVIVFALTAVMKKRRDENAILLGRLLGFKEFIMAAEVERIELLVEEDPEYFYDVLPYAYVFGLTDTWAEKFETIAVEPPRWYSGYDIADFNTYMFIRHFNNCADAVKSIVVPPADSDGGSDFGGGGSFGGGGGFSGGGFGGGGGGGW